MKSTPPFTILYENSAILAVNKRSGLAVLGDRWDKNEESLVDLLEKTVSPLFIVHRLDKETSGALIFAKTPESQSAYTQLFERSLVKKRYTAVVYGRVAWNETACDFPLVPDGNKKHLTIIDHYQGKKSYTAFKKQCTAGNFSVLECFPQTGRTHQIRVHTSALGHPIICDRLYGKNPKPPYLSEIKRGWRGDRWAEKPLLSRLGLHASELIFPDGLTISAPFQKDFSALFDQLQKNARPF